MLEAAVKFVQDLATVTLAAATNAMTERESLEAKLTQVEATAEELRAAVTATNEAAEKATTTAAAETAAHEKTMLESKVAELEQDLATTSTDLRMANKQFFEVATKLQDTTVEVTQLRNANSQLEQDVDGEWASNAIGRGFLSFH
jgi:chromosome segregation ATPase